MAHADFILATDDGLKLHGREWKPELESRAVVCLLHGLDDTALSRPILPERPADPRPDHGQPCGGYDSQR
ncbi:MAG: hypothetical protein U9P12_07770 [Verrucomicrobiota bacterium]|nr:hypothetical protein [Verrucomicrobiota bacterium]